MDQLQAQKNQYGIVRNKCLKEPNFKYTEREGGVPPKTYLLLGDLLMVEEGYEKIVVPNIMVGLLLSYTHLYFSPRKNVESWLQTEANGKGLKL